MPQPLHMQPRKESNLYGNPSISRLNTAPVFTKTRPEPVTLPEGIEKPATERFQEAAPREKRRNNAAAPLGWYRLIDAAALSLAFFIAWKLAGLTNGFMFNRPLYNPQQMQDAFLRIAQYCIIAGGVLLNFESLGHYKLRMSGWIETQHILGTLGIAMIVDGFLQFAAKQDFSRMSLVLSWALAAVVMIAAHAVFRAVLRHFDLWRVRVLLVGDGSMARDIRAAIKSEPSLGYNIVSYVDDLPQAFERAGKSWRALALQHDADYILVALDGPELAAAEEPIAQLMREEVAFSIAPPMRRIPVLGMVPQYFLNRDVMLLTPHKGLEQALPRLVKRSFDVMVSGAALVVLSPLMLWIASLIKRDGGPAVFGHKRIGLNGETFICLKFRSMVMNGDEILEKYLTNNRDANAEWQRDRKLRHDPRVTRLGRFLRRTSLDELPQLFNVLCGHMSLVGPRPIVVAEAKKYDDDIAYYYRVRPGITGLWQVSGRNDVSYEERVRIDAWYVRNWSLWHDITILCKTFSVLLSRAGAY